MLLGRTSPHRVTSGSASTTSTRCGPAGPQAAPVDQLCLPGLPVAAAEVGGRERRLRTRGDRQAGVDDQPDRARRLWSTWAWPAKADRMPNELSGGEMQRVAIARAIVNRPVVLLADEPTGNPTPSPAKEIVEVLDRVNRRGTTVVMATHDRQIVDAMRRRVPGVRQRPPGPRRQARRVRHRLTHHIRGEQQTCAPISSSPKSSTGCAATSP